MPGSPYIVCLYVCLFWIRHSSLPGLIFLPVPCPPILLSCILHQVRTLPCLPVRYTYPNKVSGLSLPCLPVVHIYLNPTRMNPSTLQTPHINGISLLFPKQFHINLQVVQIFEETGVPYKYHCIKPLSHGNRPRFVSG